MGAIGCVAFGIGTTDVFNSWITKDVRARVPESVKVVIRGKKHPNVTAKDFILKILSLDYVRSGKALAKVMVLEPPSGRTSWLLWPPLLWPTCLRTTWVPRLSPLSKFDER